MVLYQLLAATEDAARQHEVISLTTAGPVADRIRTIGVRVIALGARPSPLALVPAVVRLWRHLRRSKPDVVQTWMYHADLIGGVVARLAGVRAVVWGLHAGLLPPPGEKRFMKLMVRIAAVLSRVVPRTIVCCSETSRVVHEAVGYDPARMVVIENGFEPAALVEADRRSAARRALGIDDGDEVVGRVARFHPQKDYATMVAAAALVVAVRPGVRFVFVGKDITEANDELWHEIVSAGIDRSVLLLGERDDMDDVYDALDVAVSSSRFGEALPLVVGEAMARGIPVVSTDVGDVREILGDDVDVVPAAEPGLLADAIVKLLDAGYAERRRIATSGRDRVLARFGVAAMRARYDAVYTAVASGRGG